MERDEQAVGLADALRAFGQKESRFGVGRVEAFVDGLDEPADFAGDKSGLKKITGAGFEGTAFRVRDPLKVDDALQATAQNFVFGLQYVFQHGFMFHHVSIRVKKSVAN